LRLKTANAAKILFRPEEERKMAEHSSPQIPEVTGLLIAWGEGDRDALERLTPMVDVELRRIAQGLPEPGKVRSRTANHRFGQRSLDAVD
jgi:hypothetical protein